MAGRKKREASSVGLADPPASKAPAKPPAEFDPTSTAGNHPIDVGVDAPPPSPTVGVGLLRPEGPATDQLPMAEHPVRRMELGLGTGNEDMMPLPIETVGAEELKQAHMDRVAFYEEPVEIYIESKALNGGAQLLEDVPCSVNGEGPEIMIDRRWVTIPNRHFPTDTLLITKRKYVEVLGRGRRDNVKTVAKVGPNGGEVNEVRTSSEYRFTCHIVRDPNPRGMAWWKSLLRTRV